MRLIAWFLLVVSVYSPRNGAESSTQLDVVVSIRPLHSLVAQITDGVAEPKLLIDQMVSPHAASLRPSQARMLSEADIIFWFGPQLETFLSKPLSVLAKPVVRVAMLEAEDVVALPVRHDENFATSFDLHTSEPESEHRHSIDPHIWLDPKIARSMLREIASTLSMARPEKEDWFAANLARAEERLHEAEAEIATRLSGADRLRFVSFHDAYQYFERRFGLVSRGVIALNPEVPIGAKRLSDLAERFRQEPVDCVVFEPFYPTKHIAAIASLSRATTVMIDPVGTEFEPGADLYDRLIETVAAGFAECLSN